MALGFLNSFARAEPNSVKVEITDEQRIKVLENKCHDGDGSTCLELGQYLAEKSIYKSYQSVLNYGCHQKNRKDCCDQIYADRVEGIAIEKNVTVVILMPV